MKKTSKIIFVADDDEDDRMLIREAVESVVPDVKILEVVDGKELIDLLEKSQVNANSEASLILMDMNMPRMSGLEALAIVKADPTHRHIPIVMLSTSANPAMVSEAYHLGTNAYITKPVSTAEYLRVARAVDAWFLNHYAPI